MADEEKKADAQQAQPKGSSLISKYALPLGLVMIAVIGALLVFKFVVLPVMGGSDEVQPTTDDLEIPTMIPAAAVALSFDDKYVEVIMEDPDMPASLLMYAVTLICANQDTADLVEKHRPFFENMLLDLHESHTREELKETKSLVKETIQKRALQKANELLGRFEEPSKDVVILDVLHTNFAMTDMM